jgi:hypothetical protein
LHVEFKRTRNIFADLLNNESLYSFQNKTLHNKVVDGLVYKLFIT